MNRTLLLFAAAGVLALVALFVSPRPSKQHTNPPPLIHSTGQGSLEMTSRFSHPLLPPGLSETYVTVDIRGVDVAGAKRRPIHLALVIDRSGSMEGRKLANAKAAARHLISQLTPEDTLALIHYGSDVEVLPGRSMTPANREVMLAAVDRMEDAGGTNTSEALVEAGKALPSDGLRRIILVSDGKPTEGDTTFAGLTGVAKQLRQRGANVSAIGVGAEFNEDLMQAIAELGAGSYGFLRDSSQLASLFSRDLQQGSSLVAKNVELTIELPAGVALKDALGYQFTQTGRQVRVALTDFASRQTERVVLALNVNAAAPGSKLPVAVLALAYDDLLAQKPQVAQSSLNAEVTDQLALVDERQDKTVAVNAARAQSARNVVRAAEAMSQGNKEEAKSILSLNRGLFEKAAQVAGAPAVEQDQKSNAELYRDFDSAKDDEARSYSVKGAKLKALHDFGREGSTY